MAEYKLFEGEIPYVSTREFHTDRKRAPHLEQPGHRERLIIAASLVARSLGLSERFCEAYRSTHPLPVAIQQSEKTFSDLGCGDGGLLSLVQDWFLAAWGFDFQPSNQAGWAQRGVEAELFDVFGRLRNGVYRGAPMIGNVVAMTEVLEHLADPRAALIWLRGIDKVEHLICSSPFTETDKNHCEEHAWAWDLAGYAELLADCGWHILERHTTGMFQVVLAQPDYKPWPAWAERNN